jgi:RimJ/RimL family protein N-acetyltransferase
MDLPIDTPEFRLRRYRRSDVTAVFELRSDPTTADWQSWSFPYSIEKAQQMVDRVLQLDGPTAGQSWGLVIADPSTDAFLGNLFVRLADHGHSAEIGYALCVDRRGLGLASKALSALVNQLFENPEINRLEASMHPDNSASKMVVERLGFTYEGSSRQSYWVDDVVSDDSHYGLLRNEWEIWQARTTTPPKNVELVAITDENFEAVAALATHHSQQRFVSPVLRSLAQALVPPKEAGVPLAPWFRAVVADGVVAGFVMLADVTETIPDPYLWRLLIDRTHQRRGIGRGVLDLIVADRLAKGDRQLFVSYHPGPGSPEPLYRKYGFVPTGNVDDDGEIEAHLDLNRQNRWP